METNANVFFSFLFGWACKVEEEEVEPGRREPITAVSSIGSFSCAQFIDESERHVDPPNCSPLPPCSCYPFAPTSSETTETQIDRSLVQNGDLRTTTLLANQFFDYSDGGHRMLRRPMAQRLLSHVPVVRGSPNTQRPSLFRYVTTISTSIIELSQL